MYIVSIIIKFSRYMCSYANKYKASVHISGEHTYEIYSLAYVRQKAIKSNVCGAAA